MYSVVGENITPTTINQSSKGGKTMNTEKWKLVNKDVLALPVREFLEVMDDAITNGFTIIIKDGKLYYCDEVDANE